MRNVSGFVGSLAVLTVLISVPVGAAEDPTTHPNPLQLSEIRSDHPRIWFNSENVILLRQRWNDSAMASIVNQYKGRSDALSLALEGLATNNGGKCSQAAAKVGSAYSPGGAPAAGYVDPISLVFDWCYDYLNSSERSSLVSKIKILRDEHKNHRDTGIRDRFQWHESFLVSSFAYVASVLAIEGEAGVTSEMRLAQNVLQNLQELGDEISGDGGYRTYIYQGNIQTLPFLMWSAATNFDFASRSNFTRNLTAWSAYKLSPTGGGFLRGPADDDGVETGYTMDVLSAGGFYMLASHFDDPVAQWMGNHHKSSFHQSLHWQWEGPSFISLVNYDPNRQAKSPAQAGMPLVSYFDKIGMVHMRSAWEGSDAIHMWFYNGPEGGHSGASQNHFTIWRGNDPLIMQGGNYLGTPSTYHEHYYWPSVSDNTLLFSPIGSNSPDYAGGQKGGSTLSQASQEAFPVATRIATRNSPAYRGEIIHFEDTDDYTVASGDATVSYDSDTVNSYVRDYVYLKPDIVIIRDRFDTQNNVATIRSLIHSRTKPVFTGTPTIVEGSASAGILEKSASTFRIKNGASEAKVDILWPANPKLRFIGGVGYEGYADGYNADPLTDCQSWLQNHWELAERKKLIDGQWRTEIETTPEKADGDLIHAIFVSKQNPDERPEFSINSDGANLVVVVTFQGDTHEVVFPADSAPVVDGGSSELIFGDGVESGGLWLWSEVVE